MRWPGRRGDAIARLSIVEVAQRGPWMSAVSGVAINQVALFLSLGTFAVVSARLLGPSNRGVLVLFMTLSSLFMLVGSLGSNTAARVRLVAARDSLALEHYLGLTVALAAAQLITASVLGGLVLARSHALVNGWVLPLFVVYSVFNLFTLMWRDALYAFGRTSAASRGDAAGAAAQLLFFGLLVIVAHASLPTALIAVVLGDVAQLAFFARRFRAAGLSLRPAVDVLVWRHHVRRGLPALVVDLGQAMTIRFDRVLLALLATTADVGIYGVAATLTEILWLVPTSLAQVVFHRVASSSVTLRQLRRIRLANLALSVLLGVGLVVLAPVLIGVVFGATFEPAIGPMRILVIASVAVASYQLDITCISASNRLSAASAVTAVGFSSVLVLDLVLIPRFGLYGAAWASVIAYAAMAGLSAFRVHLLEGRLNG